MTKKIIIPFLLLVFTLSMVSEATAQKKRRKSKSDEDTEDTRRSRRDRGDDDETYNGFSQKLTWDINIGNIFLSNQQFGLSLKPAVGYKVSDRFTPGIGLKYYYTFFNQPAGIEDVSFHDIGAFVYSRFKITETIFLQGEYSYTSFDGGPNQENRNLTYPLLGGGYVSGFGDWVGSLQILFIFDDEVRDVAQYPLEFWFGFVKNF